MHTKKSLVIQLVNRYIEKEKANASSRKLTI